MCGRYVAATPPDQLAGLFGVTDIRAGDLGPHWNVAPTMDVYAVAEGSDGDRRLGAFRWGLVPWFSKGPAGAAKMINARAETVAEKPSFRRALERRRCILPADGFYEWLRTGKEKLPHLFAAADGSVLGLAGLWEVWRPTDEPDAEPLRTCAIVTTTANATMAPIHDRMPVVLAPDTWSAWLDRGTTRASEVAGLLAPALDGVLVRRAVSPRVNNVRNDDPGLLEPHPQATLGAPSEA
jgi:putative SOS response-associated peptidase YedK